MKTFLNYERAVLTTSAQISLKFCNFRHMLPIFFEDDVREFGCKYLFQIAQKHLIGTLHRRSAASPYEL